MREDNRNRSKISQGRMAVVLLILAIIAVPAVALGTDLTLNTTEPTAGVLGETPQDPDDELLDPGEEGTTLPEPTPTETVEAEVTSEATEQLPESVGISASESAPLPQTRMLPIKVANDAGVKYPGWDQAWGTNPANTNSGPFECPANAYEITAGGGGLNQLHIVSSPGNTGQVTRTLAQSGTFYIKTTGGRGSNDDVLLLLTVQDPIPSNFSIHLKSSGYTWTPPTPGISNPPLPTTLTYVPVALDETFTRDDFIYGPQTWRPGPGGVAPYTPPSTLNLYPGQSISDPTTNAYLMFVDLNVGNINNPSLTDQGTVKVEYEFTNLETTAAFTPYAWASASNQGEGISWTTSASDPTLGRVWVVDVPPVAADFTANATNGTAPLAVQFTDTSTGHPTSWAWDFENDGTIDSTEPNPSYTYTTAGTYTVNLTVTNDAGSDFAVKTDYITVTESAGPSGPRTWTVGSEGCDFETLDAAFTNEALQDGDIICILNGSYTQSASISKSITIRGESADVVTVVPGGSFSGTGMVIESIRFSGGSIELSGTDSVVRNCTFEEFKTLESIKISGAHVTIDGNTFQNNNVDRPVELTGSNHVITNNTFANNVGQPSQALIRMTGCSGVTITRNSFLNNGYAAIGLRQPGADNRIYLNTFSGNQGTTPVRGFQGTPQAVAWVSPEPVTYTYRSIQHTEVLGNYWSTYPGTDEDRNGIADAAYALGVANQIDTAPLVDAWQHYFGAEHVLADIAVSPLTDLLLASDTRQFTAQAYDQEQFPMQGVAFSWASSNETVGTIDQQGIFTALSPGTATVTASNGSIAGTATVTVRPADPMTIVVDGSGSGDYSTIQSALNVAIDKDTIIIRNGTYAENIIISKALTVRSETGPAGTVITAADPAVAVMRVTADGVIISGLSIVGTPEGNEGLAAHGIYLEQADNCTIQESVISKASNGVYVYRGNNNTITRNTLTRNNNAVFIYGYGISSLDPHLANHNVITENVFTGNNGGSEYGAIRFNAADNTLVTNNTVTSNGAYGILLHRADETEVAHNNISSNGNAGIYLWISYHNTIHENTITANPVGFLINRGTEASDIYLNDIAGNDVPLQSDSGHEQNWNTTECATYQYGGNVHVSRVGNYWGSNYTGTDTDGNGIGDESYTVHSTYWETFTDYYPLIAPFGNYAFPETAAPLEANFTATPLTGDAPLAVAFTDASTGSPISWAWDFENDGVVDSTEPNPIHIYTAPGTYTVNLTVADAGGSDSEIKTGYIIVTESSGPSGPRTWTVGAEGCDFTALDEAIANPQLQDGEIIYVYNGSYTLSGSTSKILTILGEGADVVTVRSSSATFSGAGTVVEGIAFAGGMITFGNANGAIRNCTFQGMTGNAVVSGTGIVFEKNTVRNNTINQPIDVTGSNCLITNNTFAYNGLLPTGTQTPLRLNGCSNVTVAWNNFIGNTGGIGLRSAGSGNHVYLNTFYENTLNVRASGGTSQAVTWNTPAAMEYTFDGVPHNGLLGNYWSTYTGTDANGDGIGDVAFSLGATGQTDNYPLIDRAPYYFGARHTAASIVIAPASATLDVADALQFAATAYEVDGYPAPEIAFAWTSSNVTVGTVDATGFFTALAPGTTDITATSGNVSGTAAVTVQIPDIQANFTASPLIGEVPLTVQFTDASIGAGITSWAWDFENDGVVDSTEQNPTHTYSSVGNQSVNLTISGIAGTDSELKSEYIAVLGKQSLKAWGSNSYGQIDTPLGTDFTSIAAGTGTGFATRSDGSVAAWGFNQSGELAVPSGNFTAVASCIEMVAGLKSDGSIVTWGAEKGLDPAGNNYTAIAVGRGHGIALKSDGSLVSWGERKYFNKYGQMDVPAGNDFVAIDADQTNGIALRSNGSLVAWGENTYGECDVPAGNDFVAVSAGFHHSLALRENGTIVGWGWNRGGECDTPPGTFKAIYAGFQYSLALRSDGSLYAWGYNTNVESTNVSGHDFKDITGGSSFGLALRDLSGSPAPVAALAADVRSGQPGLAVNFTDQSTNTPTAWTWDFENDGVVDSILKNPTHTYAAPGTYTVNLTVYNAAGQSTAVETDYVVISGQLPEAPVADFSAVPTSGDAPLTVQFSDTSSGNPTSWTWDFENDGVIDSTEQNPVHTYSAPGTYTVNLTVTNNGGSDSTVKTDYITVTEPSGPSGPAPLPAPRHIFIEVANDAGVMFNWDSIRYGGPNGTYYIKADGGGLNELHITNDVNVAGGQVTVSNDQSGTFYFTNTGGRGFDNDIILLASVQGPIPDDFALHIKSSGYDWTPAPSGAYNPTVPTDYHHVEGIDEVFTKEDFIYGPQTWKPGPGSLEVPSLPLYSGQDIKDPSTEQYLMFIDLYAGNMYPTKVGTTLIDNGAVKVEYSFTNLTTLAAFNGYGWCSAANQDQGISWTNQLSGTTASGYSVIGTGLSPKVSRIEVTPAQAALTIGKDQQFIATAYDADGSEMTGITFTWSSSNESVGTVDTTGFFTALATGTTDVAASYGAVSGSAAVTVTVTEPVGPEPVAGFAADVTSGDVPLVVRFTDTSTDATSWLWTFGDGATSTEQNPVHTYTQVGRFTVTLTVANAAGSSSATGVVTTRDIPPAPPQAAENFTLGDDAVTAGAGGQQVTFNATAGTGNVTTDGNDILLQTGGLTVTIKTEGLIDNASTGNVTGNVTGVHLESAPVNATVGSAGNVSVSFAAEMDNYDPALGITTTIYDQPGDATKTAFVLAAQEDEGSEIAGIAYAVYFNKTTPTDTIRDAVLRLTVSPDWVDRNGGVDAIRIFRLGDDGNRSVLQTTYAGTENGMMVFTAVSPEGFSAFALGAVAGPASAPVSSGSSSSGSSTAVGAASNLKAGESATLAMRMTAVSAVTVTTNNAVKDVMVTVASGSLPQAAKPPAGTLYQYVQATLYKAAEDDLATVQLRFAVPAAWLAEHGCTAGQIALLRHTADGWQNVPVEVLGDEDGNAVFTAGPDAFGLFAIAATGEVPGAAGDATPGPTAAETPAGTATTAPPADTTPATPQATPLPVWAAILAFGGALLLVRRT